MLGHPSPSSSFQSTVDWMTQGDHVSVKTGNFTEFDRYQGIDQKSGKYGNSVLLGGNC